MKKILFFFVFLLIGLLYLKIAKQSQTVLFGQNLQRSFEIYRDNKGVAHIYGQKQQDILFGLGYAEAQDRLWSIYIKKFFTEGRMSELFGRQGLKTDLFARNFKFHDIGIMNAKLLDTQTKKKAQAYCDGINHYARNSKFLSIQFYILWLEWEDWTVQNTLGLLAFSSFSLEFDWMYQIARQRLLETVGFDLAYQIINFGSKTLFRQVTIMKQDQLKQQNIWQNYNASKTIDILREHWASKKTSLGSIHLPTFEYEGSGSNAWVIGGNHTKNGKPLLANDPHLGSLSPPAFYVTELVLLDENKNVKIQTFGASMSGVPGISIGVNKLAAWGSTASYVDNKDLFYQTVRINQNQQFQYFHENEWKDFTKREQIYKVRWEGQERRVMYENHRGPVLQNIFDEIYYKYSYPFPDQYRLNHTITIDAAIYKPDSTSLYGLINIAFASQYEKFENCSHSINAPNIDSGFITNTGNFGYAAVGRIPIRQIYEMSGFIKDGRTSKYEMKGFLPSEQKPELLNPKRGYLAMCNNKFAPDSFNYRSSLHEITTGRAYRLQRIITQKIKSGHKFTIQDMKNMQLDTRDQFLSEAFPLVLQKLQTLRYIWSNAKTQKYFQLLQKWDYVMEKDSVESTLYHVFERLLQNSFLTETDLNEQERQAIINHAFFENYQFRLFQKIKNGDLGKDQRLVCQSKDTRNFTNLHACQASIAIAFKRITQQVERIFQTSDITKYKWGDIHLATFKSIPFSDIPGLNKIWGRQTPAGGNSRSLNVGILTHQSKGQNKYRSVAGPIFRFITDLNETYWSLDLGNSGNLNSPFYDNFMGTDEYVEYKPENPNIRIPQNWRLTAKSE